MVSTIPFIVKCCLIKSERHRPDAAAMLIHNFVTNPHSSTLLTQRLLYYRRQLESTAKMLILMITELMVMLSSLEDYRVASLPSKFFYIPNFINEEEEKDLLKHIYASPLPKWVALRDRRLQNWGGIPHVKGMLVEKIPQWLQVYVNRVSALNLFHENKANHALVNEYECGQGILPHHDGPLYYPVVATINLNSYGVLDFYTPLDRDTDQMEQSTLLEDRYIGSVYLERCSLNIVSEELYTHYMHGIAQRETDLLIQWESNSMSSVKTVDNTAVIHNWSASNLNVIDDDDDGDSQSQLLRQRGKRVSVTIRYVPNVSKLSVKDLLFKK
uniref:Fe2OG dioxygenase domain-containing protein n=1 Tax=Trichobilharzia regenti TaxID=157069 RepID=A0AA85KBC1_TRIRE|nr:unnamed protein product [Trichobilharzia regenti]